MATLADLLTSKIPPHSLEAERAVLGALLFEREAWPRILERISATDFYKEGHRKIFAAMVCTVEAGGGVDLVTLSEALRQADALDEIGGPAYLGLLLQEAALLTRLDDYAAIVRDKAALRELIRYGTETIGAAYANGQPPAALLATASTQLAALLERAGPAAGAPTSRILSGPALMTQPIVRPDWAVEGLFSRGHQHSILGVSQGAKTWAMFDLGADSVHFHAERIQAAAVMLDRMQRGGLFHTEAEAIMKTVCRDGLIAVLLEDSEALEEQAAKALKGDAA